MLKNYVFPLNSPNIRFQLKRCSVNWTNKYHTNATHSTLCSVTLLRRAEADDVSGNSSKLITS